MIKTNLPELTFCGPHPKPHGERGLSKHYHLHFYPKLGHVICAIQRMKCACVACTPMLYQHWIYGTTSKKKHATNLYQIVCTGHFLAHIKLEHN